MLHLNHFIDASFFMAPDGWYQVLAFHGALPIHKQSISWLLVSFYEVITQKICTNMLKRC